MSVASFGPAVAFVAPTLFGWTHCVNVTTRVREFAADTDDTNAPPPVPPDETVYVNVFPEVWTEASGHAEAAVRACDPTTSALVVIVKLPLASEVPLATGDEPSETVTMHPAPAPPPVRVGRGFVLGLAGTLLVMSTEPVVTTTLW